MEYRTFAEYWSSLDRGKKEELAKRAKTSVAYLNQIATGFRNAGWRTIQNLRAADVNVKVSMFEAGRESLA